MLFFLTGGGGGEWGRARKFTTSDGTILGFTTSDGTILGLKAILDLYFRDCQRRESKRDQECATVIPKLQNVIMHGLK